MEDLLCQLETMLWNFGRALQTISEVDDSKRTANVEIGLVGESQTIVLMLLQPLFKCFADDPRNAPFVPLAVINDLF